MPADYSFGLKLVPTETAITNLKNLAKGASGAGAPLQDRLKAAAFKIDATGNYKTKILKPVIPLATVTTTSVDTTANGAEVVVSLTDIATIVTNIVALVDNLDVNYLKAVTTLEGLKTKLHEAVNNGVSEISTGFVPIGTIDPWLT